MLLSFMKNWNLGIWRVEKRRRKRANNSLGTGWGEEDAEGFQLRFPPAVPAFQLLSTIFLTHSLLPGFTLERTFVWFVFYTLHMFALLCFFFLPTPTLLPPTVFPDRNLTHAFLFLFQWLILSSLCFCLQSFFSFFTPLFFCLWFPKRNDHHPAGTG